MTRDEIAKVVAVKFNVDVKHGHELVEEVMLSLVSALMMRRDIEIRGFGSFRVKTRPSRQRYNPLTKTIDTTKPRTDVEFRPSRQVLAHWSSTEASSPGHTPPDPAPDSD